MERFEKIPLLPSPVQDGYGVWITALLIVSEVAGGGIVSLPNALYREGWFGIAVLIGAAILCSYTGMQLGWCWTIMQERWPVYKMHTKQPYAQIGFRAGGHLGRIAVSTCVYITLFGISTVFLLLASSNISDLLQRWFHSNISFCYWLLVVALVMLPITFLGSPKNFWFGRMWCFFSAQLQPVAIGAVGSTSIAVIIIIIGINQSYHQNPRPITYGNRTFVDFVLGYGTIMFSFGGHAAFPTIQHDMKYPSYFFSAVTKSYIVITSYYLSVSIFAYAVYGDTLATDNNILRFLPSGWIQDITTVLITLHVLFSLIIIVNPVNQELEHLFHIENRLTWKRIVVRTVLFAMVLLVAESVPSFGIILDLIGGTTVACMTFVFPGIFYLLLRLKKSESGIHSRHDRPIRWYEWVVNLAVITLGILGGIASLYAAVQTVVAGSNDLFQLPCYL